MQKFLLSLPDRIDWNQGIPCQQKLSILKKILYFASQPFSLVRGFVQLASLFSKPQRRSEERKGEKTSSLPRYCGFADSLFQTSGLGTRAAATRLDGIADWDRWLNPKKIEGLGNPQRFFVDVLGNPDPYIEILKELQVTAHRFSLEWSVIEPQPGQYNEEAIALYRNFIDKLVQAGIEPFVTLCHFVLPSWFVEKGGFCRMKNIDLFVNHSVRMMEIFSQVTHWITFNEVGVDGFQKYIDGKYPPGIKGDLLSAGKAMRNMLVAHCKIFQAKKQLYRPLKVGITHQWLNFRPISGNFLEKLICYRYSKIMHRALYDFYKTGQFSLTALCKANVQFSIPKEEFEQNGKFLDFLGIQFYGFPLLKIGRNGGKKYPGYKIINKWGFTFGATCLENGKMMSFGGVGVYPEMFQECLQEASTLGVPIAITEIGCDAKIQKWGCDQFALCDDTQLGYFKTIIPILQQYKGEVLAFFAWTLFRDHLEWDRGDFPSLGTVILKKDQSRKIAGYTLSPAAKFLQQTYKAVRESGL